MTRLVASLVALAAVLAVPGAAQAHATVQSSTPKYGQELSRSPARVVLRFDQRVTLIPNALRVLDYQGHVKSGPVRLDPGGQSISAPIRPLGKGGYTVRWEAFSQDSHIVSGVFTFGVLQPAPDVMDAFGATGPTTTEDVVRWLAFVGLALVLGGLGFRIFILPGPLSARLDGRLFVLTLAGCIGVLEVGLVAFLLRAEDALQAPFAKFLYSDLSPIARTRFGTAFVAMTLGFALVTALVFLTWLTGREVLRWPAFVLALCFASGFSLSGHSAAGPNTSRWSALADWAHLGAASLWAGGLVMLLVTIVVAPELRSVAFVRFGKLAMVLIAIVLAAGVYLAALHLAAVDELWTTHYGRVLLVKLSLVCLALAWGGFHHFVVGPRLQRPAVASRVHRSLAGEAVVGMAVLLLAAVLVNSAPPPTTGAGQAAPQAGRTP
jgi:copper transport protein